MFKIGIQGIQASFHDLAAQKFFSSQPNGKYTAVECSSFLGLCEALHSGRADACLMAIENSIAGSILPNYSLLERFGFRIIGEVYLRIELALMALPGQTVSDLQFVKSHPMALHQCGDFLFQYPTITPLEGTDTAESAKEIAEKKLVRYGAVASTLAAERYGLQILAKGIETNQLSYTRFLAIIRNGTQSTFKDWMIPQELANKASLRFETAHTPGSLADVLLMFKRYQLNLAKIQSVPIPGKPYQYSIHVDVEWEDRGSYDQAMEDLGKQALEVRHFGEYKRGEKPFL